MAEKDKSESNVSISKPATEATARRGELVSFDDLEHWFENVFSNRWMTDFRRSWPGFREFGQLRPPFEGRWPKVDMVEREDDVLVRAELPGVSREDLDVSITDSTVTIKATTKAETEDEKDHYHRREMTRGEFVRSLQLPQEVDTEAAKACLKDGVLELVMPKVKKSPRKSVKVE